MQVIPLTLIGPSTNRSAVLAAVLVLAALLRVGAQLEVLCALDRLHPLGLALRALELQHDLLRRLRLLVEDGLCLTHKARLLLVVPPLALCAQRGLSGLVLRDLMRGVLLALAAIRVPDLRDVHHGSMRLCASGSAMPGAEP